eukprot:GFUD01030652.1.p1 GENE.GFUD01030652.1~~GFUD01030652.1.p1  ORF type:complete len:119 (-),score=28.23 GFUD01030652.1:367-723(-)
MKIYLLLLFSAQILQSCVGGIQIEHMGISVPTNPDPECGGSLTMFEYGGSETVVTEDEDVRVRVENVRLEGNCCFTLHSRRRGRGKTYYLTRRGEHSVEDIGWSRVRSVRKVECIILD